MRTTIICGAGILSGKEMMSLELGDGLRQAGQDVSYITSKWGDGQFRARLHQMGFAPVCMRLGFISATLSWSCIAMTVDQLVRVPALWFAYRRFMRKQSPNHVIHTNWHHLLVLFPILDRQRDWFWIHDLIPDKSHYRAVFCGLSKRLKGFIAVSEAVKDALLQLGVDGSKIHVIHNGLTDPTLSIRPGEEGRKAVRIGIVGQVAPWKGHEDLFDAYARVAAKHPLTELHIYGAGSLDFERRLQKAIPDAALASRITWHGFVRDRVAIYSNLDICVVPSRAPDSLPTTAIEAAYFGLPVVATRSGGLPEIVEDSVTGYLVGTSCPDELAEKLDALIEDERARHSMGTAAQRLARERFSKSRFVEEFDALLRSASPVDV